MVGEYAYSYGLEVVEMFEEDGGATFYPSQKNEMELFLARNADPALTEPIEALCQQNQIESVWVPSMTDLGHACGIDVGAAAAAVID